MAIDTRTTEDKDLDDVLKSNTVEKVDIFMDKVAGKDGVNIESIGAISILESSISSGNGVNSMEKVHQ